MGVFSLFQLIKAKAPEAIIEIEISKYSNKKVAIDSYLTIYQYLIATKSIKNDKINELKDKDGNLTAHLMGILNRSVYLMQKGIRPCWIFDGIPPNEKEGILKRRFKTQSDAINNMHIAINNGDTEKALKMANRFTKISAKMLDDAKTLVQLMGLPCIEAPGESEAQCAAFVKAGSVHAVCSEDLDTLVFGGTKLIRGFQKVTDPCIEINLEIVLDKLNISYLQLIDICILSGCDYSNGIKGIGVFKALELIQEHSNVEGVIKFLKESGTKLTDDISFDEFCVNYEKARILFEDPDVINPNEIQLRWEVPDFHGIYSFLCDEKGFNKNRIQSCALKLKDYTKLISSEINNITQTSYPTKRKSESEYVDCKGLNLKKKKSCIKI